jgi:eukaryotic-like serine/threonine-protein kinase
VSLESGTRLGRYRIVARIGAGGMGEVYHARDERLNRDVAVKVLPPSFASDRERIERFEQEAQAAGSLNHPNILAIYDIGTENGAPYIVSELLDGGTLREALAKPRSTPWALDVAAQIAGGLAAAHAKGIVHRDLKPENVFVTRDGVVKILDFGLAKLTLSAADDRDAQTVGWPTQPGTVLGTVGYMSPEQVRGLAADQRSDIFSLGVILYEMLTGQRAFSGTSPADTMSAILRDQPPQLERPSIGMPPALAAVVRRSLEKRPEDRFQSASDLAFALRAASGGSAVSPGVGGRPRRAYVIAAVAAAAVLAAAATALFVARGRSGTPRVPSIAVLPLANLSNDPEQEYFSDGMTEALIADLARVGGLRVISRTSTMAYKKPAQPVKLPDIARQLNVDAVVEGSVTRSANRIRITTQLIDAKTDRHLWGESYERSLSDVLSLQAEVAQAVAQQIKVTLTPQETARLAAARPVNPAAHEAYLRGRYFLAKNTEESIGDAIAQFKRAAELDAADARPQAGLADAYTALRSTYAPPRVVMPRAKEAAQAAVRLDPGLAEAHVSMGGVLMFYDFDWPGAERELRQAIALAPNLAEAHDYLAQYFAAVGRPAEARIEADRAIALDPLSLIVLNDAGWVAYLGRRFDATVEVNRKALTLDQNFWPAHRDLGLAYEKLGRFPDAIAELQRARQLDANPSILEMLGGAYAAWGKTDEARRVLAEAAKQASEHYVCPYEIATIHAGLGETNAALEWLAKGIEERADCMPWARSDPKLDALRDNPRFKQLMREIGLP